MLIKPDPLGYMTSGSKNPKKTISLHFDPIIRGQSFFSSLYLFESNFSGIVIWIDKLHDCDERTWLSNMVFIKTAKTRFPSYPRNACLEDKCFIKNMNLVDMNYHWKIEMIGLTLGEKKMSQLPSIILRLKKKSVELKVV